ncbi:MAG TPA: VOC family protein [Candidatus Saccharimonadales bacterium]|nr:VOC family protein [Candidatus Saccharimonadales bacterium]
MLKNVLHTGIEVADLAKSIELYRNLGFEVANEFDKPEPKAKVATVKNDDTAFELWQFEDKDHPQVAFIRSHVAIYSDDLENDVQQLVDSGYKVVIPVTEGVILRYAFVQDPAGAFCYEIATRKES